MLKPLVFALLATVAGCSSLPPILQRWGGLEIATTDLHRKGGDESLYFSEDGSVQVHPSVTGAARVSWRVRGQWLEIDTTNDGTFQTRMRALAVTKDQVVAESPTRKRTVWRKDEVEFYRAGEAAVSRTLPPLIASTIVTNASNQAIQRTADRPYAQL